MKSNAAIRCGESRIAKRVRAEEYSAGGGVRLTYILSMNEGAGRQGKGREGGVGKVGGTEGLRDDN